MIDLCIGTAQFGFDYGLANIHGQPSDEEIQAIVTLALENDVACFDTAQAYGASEVKLGRALLPHRGEDRVRIISKFHPDYRHNNGSGLLDAVEKSLDKLQVENLYGLLTHRWENIPDWIQFVPDAEEIRDKGLVKHFGVSVYEPDEALSAVEHDIVDIIQIPCNILDHRWFLGNFFEKAADRNKKVFVRSIYLQGLLLMPPEQIQAQGLEWMNVHLQPYWSFLSENDLDARTFAMGALAYKCPDATLIVGVETAQQLLENIKLSRHGENMRKIAEHWWSQPPDMPLRILNPALWN